jgi:hypothetical protein
MHFGEYKLSCLFVCLPTCLQPTCCVQFDICPTIMWDFFKSLSHCCSHYNNLHIHNALSRFGGSFCLHLHALTVHNSDFSLPNTQFHLILLSSIHALLVPHFTLSLQVSLTAVRYWHRHNFFFRWSENALYSKMTASRWDVV